MQNKTVVTKGLDRPINNFEVTSNTIFLSINDTANDKLYTLPLSGSSPQLLTKTPAGCFTNVTISDNGGVMVANYESSVMPPEIVRINTNGAHTFLSNFNAEKLKTLDLKPAKPLWFTSSRGKKIKSLLVKPAGFTAAKKYPLFCSNTRRPCQLMERQLELSLELSPACSARLCITVNGLHRIGWLWRKIFKGNTIRSIQRSCR